ncbi:hypothetical protein [Bradyrhizobium diazoefficiens]
MPGAMSQRRLSDDRNVPRRDELDGDLSRSVVALRVVDLEADSIAQWTSELMRTRLAAP